MNMTAKQNTKNRHFNVDTDKKNVKRRDQKM